MIFAGVGTTGLAQSAAVPDGGEKGGAAAAETTVLSDEALSELAGEPDFTARKAVLAAETDAAALEAMLAESNQRTKMLAESLPKIHHDLRVLREQALRDSQKAKEVHAQIRQMEADLEAYVEQLPEIQARNAAAEAVHRNFLEELQHRRAISQKLESLKPGAAETVLEP